MPTGIKIYNEDGSLFFETGAHVLTSVPGFAEKIGEVAATWALAEGHLGCYYANLLETTPDDALKQLGRLTAAQVIKKTKEAAEHRLAENEIAVLLDLLGQLDAVRDRRNRVQHDLWSRRVGDYNILYAVHVDDYRRLFLELIENAKHDDRSSSVDRSIAAANHYAANTSNALTLECLENLRAEIDHVSLGLLEAISEIEIRRAA